MTYLVIPLINQDSVNNLLEQPLALPGFCFLLLKKFFFIIFMLTQEGSATLEDNLSSHQRGKWLSWDICKEHFFALYMYLDGKMNKCMFWYMAQISQCGGYLE